MSMHRCTIITVNRSSLTRRKIYSSRLTAGMALILPPANEKNYQDGTNSHPRTPEKA